MSYPPYDSYLSNLDSLVFDAPSEVIQSEKDVADELDLWSNAQFTFDVKPGVGIYDDEKSKNNSPASAPASQFESSSGLDPVTYDTLANYLDFELPRQQEESVKSASATPIVAATTPTQQHKRIQPRPLAPALPVLAASPTSIVPTAIAPIPIQPTRQILMPKPPVINANILASLLATANKVTSPVQQNKISPIVAPAPTITPSSPSVKRPLEEDEEDGQNPDEDKRRRNTAASARFRVKKKMREQAMEQSVREMAMKSDKLQDRVNNLESEIKFLRSLLLDKAAEQ